MSSAGNPLNEFQQIQNHKFDTIMEENNGQMPEEEREILIRELSARAEGLRSKYHYLSPDEEKELNDILGKIALLESQKNS